MRSWITWALLGLALVVGVVGWQLLRASYKGDVEIICNAEKGAGVTLAEHPDKIAEWITSHVGTPEGNKLWSDMTNRPVNRAKLLYDEQRHVGLGACPLLDAYAALATRGEYTSDLAAACLGHDIDDIEYIGDDARAKKIEDWAASKAKTARMKDFVSKLAAAPAKDRGDMLRREANDNAVYMCTMADRLEKAPVPRPDTSKATIAFGAPKINGDLSTIEVSAAFDKALPALHKCYDEALKKNATVGGPITFRVKLAPTGTVAVTAGMPNTPAPELSTCVKKVIETTPLPATKAPVATIEITASFVADPSKAGEADPHDPHGH